MRLRSILLCGLMFTGACADVRDERMDSVFVYGGGATVTPIREAVELAPRDDVDEGRYGLPEPGRASIADLLAVLPNQRVDRSVPDLYVAAGTVMPTTECQGGGPAQVDELPMVIDAVVTLHPRQYVKRPVCGQDERNYGTFVVEDDTGGIIVLRNSRVANFTFGDRVRLTVRAAGLTAGNPNTRAIVAADIEVLGERVPVLFEPAPSPFTADDIGRVRQVEGYIVIEPTSLNFNSMVIADAPVIEAGEATMSNVCRDRCAAPCRRQCPSPDNSACLNVFCPAICSATDNAFDATLLPTACWEASLDQELGRRGFRPSLGTPVRVTGPVVDSFGLKMWVMRIGQVEFR